MKESLSTSETLIMKAIWDKGGDISVPELTESLKNNYGKDYKRTTIGTFLDKLAAKGFVTTYRVGRLAYVQPLKDEETYKNSLIRRETDFWFHGRASDVVAALGSSRELTKEELEQIRRMLDEWDH